MQRWTEEGDHPQFQGVNQSSSSSEPGPADKRSRRLMLTKQLLRVTTSWWLRHVAGIGQRSLHRLLFTAWLLLSLPHHMMCSSRCPVPPEDSAYTPFLWHLSSPNLSSRAPSSVTLLLTPQLELHGSARMQELDKLWKTCQFHPKRVHLGLSHTSIQQSFF